MGRFYTPGGPPHTIRIGQVSELAKAVDRDDREFMWRHSWWAMAALFYGGMAVVSMLFVAFVLWIAG